MEGYVNVNFFWGGEVIRSDKDITYSIDPKKMQYIKFGTTLEEMKIIVYDLMQISRYHWKVKMTFKYPWLGDSNLVKGFWLYEITSDADVTRMLSIPATMQMGYGDVSMFIEADRIAVDDPYEFQVNPGSQPTQTTYGGGSSQPHEGYRGGWSNQFFEGYGGGPTAFKGYGVPPSQPFERYGMGSSQQFEVFRGGCSSQFDDYSRASEATHFHPPKTVGTGSSGKHLAEFEVDLVDEERHSEGDSGEAGRNSESDSSFDFGEQDDDDSESDDESNTSRRTEEGSMTLAVINKHHVSTVPWYETEEYRPISNDDREDMYLDFYPDLRELSVGSSFANKASLLAAINKAHISTDRDYRVCRSNPTQFIAECKVPSCPWRIRAACRKKNGLFQITTKDGDHNCFLDKALQVHMKITSRMISKIVKPLVIESPEIPVKTIIPLVLNMYNHQANYLKTWRGKQIAIEEVYGSWATTYETLPMFLTAMVHANEGSVAEIDADSHATDIGTISVCKRIFWCLKAVADGWQHARPVISIDGTFLKGTYRGKLLIAMGSDANGHGLPLCFALVDEETTENWSWFLQRLRSHVCRKRTRVCIISDRGAGILAAMRQHENGFRNPLGIHRYCLFHVRSNFCDKHGGGELRALCWKAGITTQLRKHEAYMKQIAEISPTAFQYLDKIPKEKWALCHDRNGARYGQATTNMMEGFNGNIRRARFLPVTAMMEYLFYRCVKIMNTHRNNVEDKLQKGEELCTRTLAMLAKYQKKATGHTVRTFSHPGGIFEVRTQQYAVKGLVKGYNKQVVNISQHSCTCGKWTTHHLPCSQVMAGCMKEALNWKQFIESYHYNHELQKVWRPVIRPLQPTEYWNYELPRDWQQFGKLVPDEGLKKKKKKRGEKGESVRIRTEMDASRTGKKCSVCKQEGHTKRNKKCPGPPGAEA